MALLVDPPVSRGEPCPCRRPAALSSHGFMRFDEATEALIGLADRRRRLICNAGSTRRSGMAAIDAVARAAPEVAEAQAAGSALGALPEWDLADLYPGR